MKRIILAILTALLCLNLASCKSKEERDLERIQKAAEEAPKAEEAPAPAIEQADWEYEKVKRDFDAYDRAMEKLNGK